MHVTLFTPPYLLYLIFPHNMYHLLSHHMLYAQLLPVTPARLQVPQGRGVLSLLFNVTFPTPCILLDTQEAFSKCLLNE